MAETAKWYVVHTYSGYENTVKATIEKTVESRQLQNQILAVSIPLETVTEITETGAGIVLRKKMLHLRELFIFKKNKPKPVTDEAKDEVKP